MIQSRPVAGGGGGGGGGGRGIHPPLELMMFTTSTVESKKGHLIVSSLASEPQIAPEALSWHENLNKK